MTEHLLVSQEGPILVITLNRPESLNAFSPEMILRLHEVFQNASGDESIRSIILRGAGRSFSAGGDVKTMGETTPTKIYDHIGKLNEVVVAMKNCSKPIISAVHGFAAGAGFNLALASDLIVASDESKFVLSFAQVGLISDGGGSYFLPRLVGPYKAKELFFLADPITALEAKELGIVNRVVPLAELEEEVLKLAGRIAAGPGKAFGMMKKVMNHSASATLEEILEEERLVQMLMVDSEDHVEGVNAFKEKRRPAFKGK